MKNYIDWKKDYSYLVKNYPDITSLYDVSTKFAITETIYIKRGNKWIAGIDIDAEKYQRPAFKSIDVEYYLNTFEAVPFFRGLGGYEKVETKYTRFGKIPFRVTSISPDKKEKIIREIWF